MGRKGQVVEKAHGLMYRLENIRNFGIVAHIDHGKTTLTDNLIYGGGLMSEELAGKEVVMDSYILEYERGITILAGNISLVYDYNGKDYLVNLIDTPGHVDFGGQVTRAMRAIDGAIVVICAVEGVMPQTETVIRQALKERVRPVLFINKVDRLINELQVTPEQMQERFAKIITKVNSLIKKFAPEEFKEKWQVDVEGGTVAFGSAYSNWAISYPFMQETKLSFKDIYDHCKQEKQKELAKKLPCYKIILDMVINHLPNPLTAQKYRIPGIWHGDLDSQAAKDMMNCNRDGKLVIMVTGMKVDPHAGEIATGRVFSGSAKKGIKVFLINKMMDATLQQIGVYMSKTERFQVEDVPAGNIAAITGLRDAYAGETVAEDRIEPFEAITHYSEPVITKSVEAKSPKDLPKLIEALRQIGKEDPTVKVQINEETGEHLISGMGELHLEIIEYMIQHDKKVEIETSKPIVVYRETVMKESPEVEGKSPNRHNKFYLVAEPMEERVYEGLMSGEIPEGRPKDIKTLAKRLEDRGMDHNEAKKIWEIYNRCAFIDMTKGAQYLNEAKDLILQGFEEAMDAGPIAQEKCTKLKIKLMDVKLHEDAVHRGPAQVIPAVKRAILAAMLYGDAVLLEPKQKLFISVSQEYMGAVSNDIQGRRGQILELTQEEDLLSIVSKVPIAEMFGFAAGIRSATQGRALWTTEYLGYERLPKEMQNQIVRNVRERKGLKAESPTPNDFLE
jgi:elongation factor 2